jgi:hypothetical protein
MRVYRPTWSTQLPFDKAFGLNLPSGEATWRAISWQDYCRVHSRVRDV